MNREQENYFQLCDHQDNKYCRECYFHKDSSPSGSWMRGGGAFRSMYLASANLLLGGKQGTHGRPVNHSWSREDRWSYSLQAGFIVGVLNEDLLRSQQSEEDRDGVFFQGSSTAETELPFVKGLLCHLGLQFVVRGIIVMSRK